MADTNATEMGEVDIERQNRTLYVLGEAAMKASHRFVFVGGGLPWNRARSAMCSHSHQNNAPTSLSLSLSLFCYFIDSTLAPGDGWLVGVSFRSVVDACGRC